MDDQVQVMILLMGLALVCGIAIGAWAADAIHDAQMERPSVAAEIATDRYVGFD